MRQVACEAALHISCHQQGVVVATINTGWIRKTSSEPPDVLLSATALKHVKVQLTSQRQSPGPAIMWGSTDKWRVSMRLIWHSNINQRARLYVAGRVHLSDGWHLSTVARRYVRVKNGPLSRGVSALFVSENLF
ncbi:hypothetical protein RRG08_043536 [Elysia crispata]|uniref:Uncharacterized protein n=1 Tax=Elysia crispata TaxID=231223 RepID=A0AAE1CYE8_9GAST|nr:hypothetical protein RRG08_043536 [Elysia crispata]